MPGSSSTASASRSSTRASGLGAALGRTQEPCGTNRVVGRHRPCHCGADVLQLRFDLQEPAQLIRAAQPFGGCLREVDVEVGMAVAQLGALSVVDLFFCVLADRLQEPVATLPRRCVFGDHQRTRDQRGEQVEHLDLVDPGAGTHRFGGLETAAPGKHRQAGQHALFVGGEQVVGPVDRGAQRRMAFDRAPLAPGEHTEPLVEPLRELRRAQHRDPGRGQLQRQRDPIEAPNHLGDRSRVGVGHREVRLHRHRPLDQQTRRVAAQHRVPVTGTLAARAIARPRCVHRRYPNPRGSSRAPPAPDTAPPARAPTRPPRRAGARSCRAPTAASFGRK